MRLRWRENRLNERIYEAFLEVKKEFPFKGYMECKLRKYLVISSLILKSVPLGSKILDVGCGPCDLTAILAKLGYSLTAIDDLRDPWHLMGKNRERIKNFAGEMGIELINEPIESVKLEENSFDAALLIDILEHSLNPRLLLNHVISSLKHGALLLIETPNSAALVKRIRILIGKSNYPSVHFIYFNVGAYRGHVREYTISELKYMLKVSGLTGIKAKLTNTETYSLICESKGLKKLIVNLYNLASTSIPVFRDTILIYGKKPKNWRPIDELTALQNLKKYYSHLTKYNLDNEPDDILIDKLRVSRERS